MIKDISLSISVGYHMVDESGQDINDVLKEAENHMYRHKVTESMSVRNQAIRAIHKALTDMFKEERIHSEKVSQLCYIMGLSLDIKDESLEELKLAGLYHDIGKIAIPDAILDKPDTLTDEEFELMKTHTEIGYQILRAADDYSRLAEYALSYHERWDGKGYPRGIEKEDIPLFARIIALADSYDPMTTNRVYRSKMTKEAEKVEL
jgi:HD-GYP domain-containing protein (c-di-GMP phosphodiesterase class II)